ncbi:MAG: hypothetical protein WCA44_03510 [Acidobacteriaceae bacterium]|jgi:hypothetical protein
MGVRHRNLVGTAAALLLVSLLSCSKEPRNAAARVEAAARAREQAMQQERAQASALNADRQELESIPLPAKGVYEAIHTRASWQNPFLVVTASTVSLTMLYPDMGPAHAPGDALLRPQAARRERLELRLSELPQALSALPQNVWPYGRVIAVEDDPSAPRQQWPQVRRNEEATLQTLSNLGVVVYEWPANGQ